MDVTEVGVRALVLPPEGGQQGPDGEPGTDPQGGARRWGLGPQRNRASGSHVIQGSERVRAGRRRRARGERFKYLCFIEGSLE